MMQSRRTRRRGDVCATAGRKEQPNLAPLSGAIAQQGPPASRAHMLKQQDDEIPTGLIIRQNDDRVGSYAAGISGTSTRTCIQAGECIETREFMRVASMESGILVSGLLNCSSIARTGFTLSCCVRRTAQRKHMASGRKWCV